MSLETDIGQLAKENANKPRTTRPSMPFKSIQNQTVPAETIQYKLSHILERFEDLAATITRLQENLINDFGAQD